MVDETISQYHHILQQYDDIVGEYDDIMPRFDETPILNGNVLFVIHPKNQGLIIM